MGTPCQAEGQGRALESCNPSRPGPAPSVPGAGVIQMPFNPHGKCLQRRPLASVLGPLGATALPPSPAPSSDHTAPAPASITSGGRAQQEHRPQRRPASGPWVVECALHAQHPGKGPEPAVCSPRPCECPVTSMDTPGSAPDAAQTQTLPVPLRRSSGISKPEARDSPLGGRSGAVFPAAPAHSCRWVVSCGCIRGERVSSGDRRSEVSDVTIAENGCSLLTRDSVSSREAFAIKGCPSFCRQNATARVTAPMSATVTSMCRGPKRPVRVGPRNVPFVTWSGPDPPAAARSACATGAKLASEIIVALSCEPSVLRERKLG